MEDAERGLNCTIAKNTNCNSCSIGMYLNCRQDRRILNTFLAAAAGIFIGTFILLGLIRLISGHLWPQLLYIILIIGLFGYETKFLCSHCPFYAGKGITLKCLANQGMPKLFRYNPAPMNRWEKSMVLFLVACFLAIAPVASTAATLWLVLAGNYGIVTFVAVSGISILLICSSIAFYQVLRTFFCSMCVNFSCPFNTVEKKIVDTYLEKNNVMKEAWEMSGYKIG